MRLDTYLSENGLCKSRAAAQALIKNGGVSVNSQVVFKNSLDVSDGDEITLDETKRLKFVGRGGLKLEAALKRWEIPLDGKICVDVGASTGGFTDCMLQHGAARVFAVDVGSAQLDERLKSDRRVVSRENTDIREFELEPPADFIGADVSFISQRLILPHIYRLLKQGGDAVVLVKPQFEAGKSALNKKGIVTSEKTRQKCVDEIQQTAEQCGFAIIGAEKSPITGGDGNIEYLLALRKQ